MEIVIILSFFFLVLKRESTGEERRVNYGADWGLVPEKVFQQATGGTCSAGTADTVCAAGSR